MKAQIGHLLLSLIIFTCIPFVTYGAVYNVDGSNFSASFQAALTNAASSSEDDTINLPAGAFYLLANTTFIYDVPYLGAPGSLTIQGSAPDSTIITGHGEDPILLIDYWYNCCSYDIPQSQWGPASDMGTTLTIRNISFQNGYHGDNETFDTYGGGIYIQTDYAPVLIEDCWFTGNKAYYDGAGALYVRTNQNTAPVTIQGCTFINNQATEDSSTAVAGAMVYQCGSGAVTVTDCQFHNNDSYNSSSSESGGGLYIEADGDVVVTGNTFSGNDVLYTYDECAGGAYIWASGSITFEDNSLSSNSAGRAGGAYLYSSNGTVTALRNDFLQNSAWEYEGGGLIVEGDNIILSSNFFSGNASFSAGGAAYVRGLGTIVDNIFLNNSATMNHSPSPDYYTGTGGALNSSPGIAVTNNTFVGNSAYHGGALFTLCGYDVGQVLNVYNNIFWDNSIVPITGCTLPDAADLLVDAGGSYPRPFTVNMFNNNYTDAYIEPIDGSTFNEADNITVDPQLNATTAQLTSTSPCIERGLNTAPGLAGILVDFYGDPRIADNDGDGTATVDMGADEYVGVLVYYDLSASVSGGNGTVTPTSGTYVENYEVTLTATPDDGYQVASWSGTDNDTSTGTTNTVTMTGDKTVTVTFEPEPVYYTLTVDIPGGNGSVSPSPASGPYLENSVVTLAATPAEGYQLASWNGTDNDVSTELTNTVTMTGDKTVTVSFEPEPVYYTLMVSAPDGNGTVVLSPESGPYLENTQVTLTATPNSGYELSAWSGTDNDTSTALTNTVTMNGDKTVNVYFTEITCSLTVTSTGEGTFSINPSLDEYVINSVVSLEATAASGWLFDHWEGDVADPNSASTTVTMDSDKAVNAVFTQIFYTLTMAASGNGTVTPSTGGHSYASGEVVSISAAPQSGWLFNRWEGAVADSESATTTVLIDSTKTVTAVFTQITYTLATNIIGQGIVALSPTQPAGGYAENFTVQLGAMPDDGWQFAGWSGDLSGTDNPAQLTMNSDKSVTATFTEVPPDQYALTIYTVGEGSVALDPAGGVYDEGTTVTLTAAPSAGFQFVSWFGTNDDSATGLTNTVNMNSARSVTVTFEPIPIPEYTLSVSVISGEGSVSPAGGTYEEGTIVPVTATPADGWQFAGWSGDITGSADSTNITMDSDKSISAMFSEIPPVEYTLGVNTTGSGTITVNPETGPYEEGTVVTITATPGEGYMFDGWNGDVGNPDAAETTVLMDADKVVEAVFIPDGDNDGVPTNEEQGPDGTDTLYDGNNDGEADAAQANVVSGHAYNEKYITLASSADTTIVNTKVEELPESAPADYDFPYGLISFAINHVTAGTSIMEIYLPEGQTCDTYYKYDEASDTWEEFLYDEATGTGAVIEGNLITLHFVDGARGDQDGMTDGIITDPGTPGIAISPAVPEEDDDSGSSGGCFIDTSEPAASPFLAIFILLIFTAGLSIVSSKKTR